jgi:hypothetical protein
MDTARIIRLFPRYVATLKHMHAERERMEREAIEARERIDTLTRLANRYLAERDSARDMLVEV